MKQFVRIGVLCAAVATFALANVTGAGAGYRIQGEIFVNPNPVEVGGTVVISNGTDEESLCESNEFNDALVYLTVYSLETDLFDEHFTAKPDVAGHWSVEFTVPNVDAALGTWEVDAWCGREQVIDVGSLDLPEFDYNLAEFEVIPVLEPVEPPSGTAPAEEVRAAPRFTG